MLFISHFISFSLLCLSMYIALPLFHVFSLCPCLSRLSWLLSYICLLNYVVADVGACTCVRTQPMLVWARVCTEANSTLAYGRWPTTRKALHHNVHIHVPVCAVAPMLCLLKPARAKRCRRGTGLAQEASLCVRALRHWDRNNWSSWAGGLHTRVLLAIAASVGVLASVLDCLAASPRHRLPPVCSAIAGGVIAMIARRLSAKIRASSVCLLTQHTSCRGCNTSVTLGSPPPRSTPDNLGHPSGTSNGPRT